MNKRFLFQYALRLGPSSAMPEEKDELFSGLLKMSTGSGSNSKRTVQAERRRKPTQAPPEGRKQAETPQRQQSGGAPPGTGYGGSGSSRPSLPGGLPVRGPVGLGLTLLFLVVLCVFMIFQRLGGDEEGLPLEEPAVVELQPTLPAPATRTPQAQSQAQARPTATQSQAGALVPPGSGDTWLVLLYQDADDKILEQDIYLDLNEAERSGSSDQVTIIAQLDRYRGGFSGDGDWTGVKRYLIQRDENLQRLRSQQLADLGEVNMADGQTLIDFAVWAIKNYPADKVALILSDHGMGWPGGWSDPAPGGRDGSRAPLATRLDDHLYLMEIDQALQEIRDQSGLEQFELVGMDACLMGQLEVFTALQPHARFAVASQEVEPALGWAYTGFLDPLIANPGMDGAALSQAIVESYISQDQRIVDDQARAEFLSQGAPMGGLFNARSTSGEQLAQQIGQSSTLTAVDLSAIPELTGRLNELALVLQELKQPVVAEARTYAQSFTSIFGNDVPPSYIDLGNFANLLKQETRNQSLTRAADGFLDALNQAIVAEKHGSKKPGASGLAIYFPNSQLYRSPVTGAESYISIARRFAEQSLWDEFLQFHYTGREFEAELVAPAAPSASTTVRAPGASKVEISALQVSSPVASSGNPVTVSADIQGENLGYIYLLAGFYDPNGNSIYLADTDYLESPDTREVDGVYYPDWGEGEFTLQFEWEPLVFAINDGTNSVSALFQPESYGQSFEQATYSVNGIYTFADSGEQRSAQLLFSNGELRQVLGFTGQDNIGAPREITPQVGDSFTVLETWLDLDQNGQVAEQVTQEGGRLIFGAQPFVWETLDAAAGDYVVGFIVEDLDGNRSESYTQVRVR